MNRGASYSSLSTYMVRRILFSMIKPDGKYFFDACFGCLPPGWISWYGKQFTSSLQVTIWMMVSPPPGWSHICQILVLLGLIANECWRHYCGLDHLCSYLCMMVCYIIFNNMLSLVFYVIYDESDLVSLILSMFLWTAQVCILVHSSNTWSSNPNIIRGQYKENCGFQYGKIFF